MNSLELRKKVTELKWKKKKNEENVPMEDLQGKYLLPYTALCGELKTCQAELKTRYIEFMRQMSEVLTEAVFADPAKEYATMHRKFHELDEACGGDPLFRSIMAAVFSFEDEKGDTAGSDRRVREIQGGIG